MNTLSRLYSGQTRFDFVGNRRRYFTISGVVLAIAVLSLLILRLNLGVDFVGGTVVEATNEANVSVDRVRSALAAVGQEGARVQSVGAGEGIRVQTGELSNEDLGRLVATVADVVGVAGADVSSQEVGPTFGAQVAQSALRALLIFLIVVTIFISIRFEWKMALAALGALLHDLLATAGIYALVGFEVTPATVVAVLTILGYSLYDTVVVFDKVEEQIEALAEKNTITEIVNSSMNQVLMRSINTSLTSLLPVGSLLFVGSFLLGAATLREFALALFVGIAAGTYSSIFFASPLLAIWKEREEDWQRARRRAARKAKRADDQPEVVPAAATEAEELAPVAAEVGAPLATGATPRPPKRRRRRR